MEDFHKSCEGVHHTVNAYLRRIAPNMTRESQKVWDEACNSKNGVKHIEHTRNIKTHYLSHAVHFNSDTHFHLDANSCWSSFDAIAPFGQYRDGKLEFRDLGIRIPSKPGDLFFIRGASLYHDAVEWKADKLGEGRMVFALFSDRFPFHWHGAKRPKDLGPIHRLRTREALLTAYPPKEWNGENWQPVASIAKVLESDYRMNRREDLDGGAASGPAKRTRPANLDTELEDGEVLESDDVQLSDGEVAPKRRRTQAPSQYPPL